MDEVLHVPEGYNPGAITLLRILKSLKTPVNDFARCVTALLLAGYEREKSLSSRLKPAMLPTVMT